MKAIVSAVLLAASLPAVSHAANFHTFKTPSGNIHCMAVRDGDKGFSDVECEIRDRDGPAAAPRPRDCDLDWGQRFAVRQRGAANMVCHGDTIATDSAPTLLYGGGIQFDGIICQAEAVGVTCRNADGRGFFLSRSSQRLF